MKASTNSFKLYVEHTQANNLVSLVGDTSLSARKIHALINRGNIPFSQKILDIPIGASLSAHIYDVIEWEVGGKNHLIALLANAEWMEDLHEEVALTQNMPISNAYVPHLTLSYDCPVGKSKQASVQNIKGMVISFNRYKISGVGQYILGQFTVDASGGRSSLSDALPFTPKYFKMNMTEGFINYFNKVFSSKDYLDFLNCIEFQSAGLNTGDNDISWIEVYDDKMTPLPLLYNGNLVYTPDLFWIRCYPDSNRLMGTTKVSFSVKGDKSDERILLQSDKIDLGFLIKNDTFFNGNN